MFHKKPKNDSSGKSRLRRHVYVGERDGLRIDYVEFEVDRIKPAKPGRRVLTLDEFEQLRNKR